MGRASRRTAALGAGLIMVVGAGHAVGRAFWATDCSVVTAVASLVGVVLGLVGAVRKPCPGDEYAVERIGGIALLVYVVLATVTQQFAWVYDRRGVAFAIAWLAPLAVGGVVLPRRGNWFAGLGCWAVLFAGTTAMSYSATHTGSGVGLGFAWLG